MMQKSKLIAGVLGVTLGAFGVHNFYLGKKDIGIIQIVVTVLTCGMGALWGTIEGFMIMAGVESRCRDANGVPLYEEEKTKITAGLLGIFLGGYGIHNFYLGKKDIAIIQLVVSLITGIGVIWGLVEGVLILCDYPGYQTDAYGNPLL